MAKILFMNSCISVKKMLHYRSRCGYSSSVECQLPKLERWVRFPLPAPNRNFSSMAFVMEFFVTIFGGTIMRFRRSLLAASITCSLLVVSFPSAVTEAASASPQVANTPVANRTLPGRPDFSQEMPRDINKNSGSVETGTSL